MPILIKTNIVGRVEATLVNRDRDATLASARVEQVEVSFGGFKDDSHAGLTRAACVRTKEQYREGTEIRNTRQISILSQEELDEVANTLDLSVVEPEWVGANLLLSGIPELTLLPPSSRLIFSSGASLVVDMENAPCAYPGRVIEEHHPGKGKAFPRAAVHRRGLTAWVEREGSIATGDEVELHIPPQRIYKPAG